MPDEISHEPEQVSLCPDQIGRWCARFLCTPEMLKTAVDRVGHSPISVAREISRICEQAMRAIRIARQTVAERIRIFNSVGDDLPDELSTALDEADALQRYAREAMDGNADAVDKLDDMLARRLNEHNRSRGGITR